MTATHGRRLLQVTTVPDTLEAFLVPFAEHFRGMGWEVEAAANGATTNEACLVAFDAVHDVPWKRSPFSAANAVAAYKIRKIVSEGGFDLVHVHTPVAAFVTRLALMRHRPGPAVVYTAHGFHFHNTGNPVTNRLYALLEKRAAPRTDWLVVINSEDEASARTLRLVPKERLTLLPGIGVDIESFQLRSREAAEPSSLKASLGLPPDAVAVLIAAEFTPNKRHVDAIRALKKLEPLLPNAHLLLAGEGRTKARAQELVDSLQLADKVHFLGHRKDIPALLKASNALMLLSEREGLPRSILEAMAVGTPVIGTRIRGVSDLLADGAGYLVPVGDIESIARAMSRVISVPDEAALVVARAHERVQGSAIAVILKAYEEVYENALSAACPCAVEGDSKQAPAAADQ